MKAIINGTLLFFNDLNHRLILINEIFNKYYIIVFD